MIIKFSKVIDVTSEDPSYPANNLLAYPPKSSWRCARPNELMATVVLQLAEPSSIIGIDIGNYHSCIIVVEGSTEEEPEKWIPIVNHQFMTHDEAVNGKFRDQVQYFTKKELNPEILKIKFNRVKVICMQSANPREIFGLQFITLRTEVVIDTGIDVFGRFKLKEKEENSDEFKEKYLNLFSNKQKQQKDYKENLKEKIRDNGMTNFNKLQEQKEREYKSKSFLEKPESNVGVLSSRAEKFKKKEKDDSPAAENVKKEEDDNTSGEDKKEKKKDNVSKFARTLFGDIIPNKPLEKEKESNKRPSSSTETHVPVKKKEKCSICESKSPDELCAKCQLLPKPKEAVVEKPQKKKVKAKKEFAKLFEDVSFALSGYVNPQRDRIRSKALKMGAKYIANPDTLTNKCTHLICAFKNTPKSQQLKGHCKIVTHKFIEDCFDQKKRIPWRRYALDDQEKNQPESEEEIEGSSSPIRQPTIYDQETEESD